MKIVLGLIAMILSYSGIFYLGYLDGVYAKPCPRVQGKPVQSIIQYPTHRICIYQHRRSI